jgi:glucose-1-phosphate cytidylyltransferase
VTVVDTGLNAMTGGRIKQVARYIGDEPFFLTYGDGVSNVDIDALVAHHRESGRLATLTAVHPDSRFGVLDIEKDRVLAFREKSEADAGWINGGFMLLSPEVMDYIEGDTTVFERTPLERLAAEGQLSAYRHRGFWQCMDTLHDKERLQRLWDEGTAPWRRWN